MRNVDLAVDETYCAVRSQPAASPSSRQQKRPNHRTHGLKADVLSFASEGDFGFGSGFRHQNLTPNPSRLGVFISASRKPRGVRAHSACAGGGHGLGHRAAGLTLFCPLFSQNLHQLFRSGTRTLPVARTSCQCVRLNGFPSNLDRQSMSRTSVIAWLHTALRTALRVPAYPRVFGRRGEVPRIAPP